MRLSRCLQIHSTSLSRMPSLNRSCWRPSCRCSRSWTAQFLLVRVVCRPF
uniref:Uncharacterized protein n=1 Tax=Mesocestoides corti TaxID=53468 RepID=A0A5K3G2C4_MESCO